MKDLVFVQKMIMQEGRMTNMAYKFPANVMKNMARTNSYINATNTVGNAARGRMDALRDMGAAGKSTLEKARSGDRSAIHRMGQTMMQQLRKRAGMGGDR